MKKLNHVLFLSILSLAVLVGCKKTRERAQPIDLSIELSVNEEVITFQVPYEKAEAIIVNKTNNEEYTAQSNAQGIINFATITPGTYSINISMSLTAEEVTELSGIFTDEDVHLNYSSDNQYFGETTSTDAQLVSSKVLGGWVFKQIYYAGSSTSDGAAFRDGFVEIYNNSSELLYADSLLFIIVHGKQNNNEGDFLLPNKQFDWSQSLNMNAEGDPTNDYVYAKAMFMIPSNGHGDLYPVQPGESIIIASTAIDHTKPYTLNNDREQSVGDPDLTVDLSQADFEVYMYPYEQAIQPGRTKFASDIDNPAVPDVVTFFATGMRDLILNALGRDSYVLAKLDGTLDPNDVPYYAIPTVRSITSNTVLYPQIPVKFILDAVEVAEVIERDRTPRRLPLPLDGGVAHVAAGRYSSESVVRKTKTIVNGRRILQDTNNSTQDFGVKTKADPSKSASSFLDN